MITTSEEPRRSGRILRIALAGSIVVHILAILLVFAVSDEARRLLAHVDVRHHVKRPDDETVTMSTALRLEKRAKPVTGAAQPHRVAQQRVPPRPHTPPVPRRIAEVPKPVLVRKPDYPTPRPLRHELAKLVPRATAPPERTAPPATPLPEKRVAALQRPSRVSEPQRASQAAQFSDAQIAKIERDLSKTIAQARSETGPLSDTRRKTLSASTRRYAMDFSGIGKDLRHAQGICHSIKAWQAGGWNYYWDSCEVQEPDGSVREKALPWPVRYRPAADPNLGTGPDPAPVLPVPGWRPDPGRPLDPDFIPYLRENGFSV